MQSHYLEGRKIDTIYFGGGTPSALPAEDIEKLLFAIKAFHEVLPHAEITLEANPDDIHPENLEAWKRSGINRLSIGVQAFQDDLLEDWNRSHNADQSLSAIKLAQQFGFHNITADLIYGGQGLSDEAWVQNIQTLVDLGIPHISAYALTVEKGTVLDYQIKKGQTKSPDDEQSNRQYSILQSILKASGYEQYEVSNFAKPGYRSKHNSGYWSGQPYLGLGPSAHSYNGHTRQWNVSNNIKYMNAIRHGKIPMEKEILTDAQKFNELVMTGLRTSEGIDVGRIRSLADNFESQLKDEIKSLLEEGKIVVSEDGNYVLRPEYYFFADGIAADLFRA